MNTQGLLVLLEEDTEEKFQSAIVTPKGGKGKGNAKKFKRNQAGIGQYKQERKWKSQRRGAAL